VEKVKVTYSIRNIDNKLTDCSYIFSSFEEAMTYVRKIRSSRGIVGSPTIEGVNK